MRIWRQLLPDERLCILPEDIIRLGNVKLLVQRFNASVATDLGKRGLMEDYHKVVQDLKISEDVHCSFFGVYDGHGGEYCAKFMSENLHEIIKKHLETQVLKAERFNAAVSTALRNAFGDADLTFKTQRPDCCKYSGSTVVTCVVIGSKIFCANIGDSRAVISKKGVAYNLSVDHKASLPREEQRIREAGGEVKCGRAMGKLAISRAMGDFLYKEKPILISEPEIRVWDINPNEDEFIVMGSDGVFDKLSSKDVVLCL
jgi:protein phosphatase 2C family protein 2/3